MLRWAEHIHQRPSRRLVIQIYEHTHYNLHCFIPSAGRMHETSRDIRFDPDNVICSQSGIAALPHKKLHSPFTLAAEGGSQSTRRNSLCLCHACAAQSSFSVAQYWQRAVTYS
eukprot:3449160-Pleurochrysis_carterae.AAC.1